MNIPESPLRAAIEANLVAINQGIVLLGHLGTERFETRVPACFNSSIGGHMRHIIDHYKALLSGLPTNQIDYEKRDRDPLTETDPEYAGDLLQKIAEELHSLSPSSVDQKLRYRNETSPDLLSTTSLLRELEFLLSHTVHHFALIAVMARLQGHEPETTFGIAPSTLRYQQSQSACAR